MSRRRISFVSNPILGLNDSQIENQLSTAFSIAGDTATLNSRIMAGVGCALGGGAEPKQTSGG
jgi:hypothetical protein